MTKKGIETKRKVLETFLTLMGKKEYDEINIKEICNLTKISIGAFYHHFKSKDDLIIATYLDTDYHFELLEKKGVYSSELALESIKKIIGSQIDLIQKHSLEKISHLYKSQINHSNDFFISHNRYLFELIKKYFENAYKQGEISTNAFEEYTEEVLILSRGYIYNWCLNNGSFNLKERVIKILDIYFKSLK